MRMQFLSVVGLWLLLGAPLAPVRAELSPAMTELTGATVPETVNNITQHLQAQGFEVVLTVDHAAAAASVGLDLAPTQVLFARAPRLVERRLLSRSTTTGIDMPLKFLVFENDGEIEITANHVGYLLDRHSIRSSDLLLYLLDGSIESVTAAPNGLITVPSSQSRALTVQSLVDAISANPAFRIPLVLDYAAEERGGERGRRRHPAGANATLIAFGNPNVGTPLMQADQRIGIDLPLKFLVWETADGSVNITYNDPFFLAERHNIQDQAARLSAMSNALANFAQAGAGSN